MRTKLTKKEVQLISCFLFCPLLLLLTFGIAPLLAVVQYSFTSWNGLTPTKTYIGWDNYIKVLTDPMYLKVLGNSFIYFISGVIQIGIGLLLAILLSGQVRGKGFFKAIFIFPILISGMAIAMLFKVFLSPGGGLDQLLVLLGLEQYQRYWLGDPGVVNYTLGALSLWRYTGQSFILYYGALQTIPSEHHRLAAIEGCSAWDKLRYITLPGIHLVMKINFVLLTIGAISAFELPFILTNGANGTATFLLQTVKTAFEKRDFGLAASMAVIISLVMLILSSLQRKWYKGEEND